MRRYLPPSFVKNRDSPYSDTYNNSFIWANEFTFYHPYSHHLGECLTIVDFSKHFFLRKATSVMNK